MSRIAGRTTQRGKNHSIQAVNQMLSQLPGSTKQFTATDTIGLGIKKTDSALTHDLYSDENVLCVVDGWIFNSRLLSASISGVSPSEPAKLIAKMFLRFGFENTLVKLNGDFSIALYDVRACSLLLARDRFGVKPLYYSNTADGLAFASQPWALISDPDVSSEINPHFAAAFASLHYRTFDNRPEESPYRYISQLPAASYLLHSKKSLSVKTYWQLEPAPDFEDDRANLAKQYRELLLDSVELRISTGAKNAFTLSGGLDSSSVTSCARNITGQQQTAYSAIYEDKTFDESDEIRPMLKENVSQWNAVLIGNEIDLSKEVEYLVQQHNEPVATATWLAHNRICKKAASDDFGLILGGLGGDELNAGEYEYFIFHFADLMEQTPAASLGNELAAWAHHHNHPLYPKTPEIGLAEIARLTDSHTGTCLPDWKRAKRYIHTLKPEYYSGELLDIRMEHPFDSHLKNRTYQDIFFETLPCCLRAEDRNASAVGMSQTNPFLDHRLVEFMFRVDGTHKIEKGISKILLREAMKDILPEETRTRITKVGWNAPAQKWFSRRELELLRDTVVSSEFESFGIYNRAAVLEIIDDHAAILSSREPRENHMMFLWQLVNLTTWLSINKSIKRSLKNVAKPMD
tara:strand:- start:40765 stop:42660 length:1896 start_codon:yes stop_codon:yes gene_type:complete